MRNKDLFLTSGQKHKLTRTNTKEKANLNHKNYEACCSQGDDQMIDAWCQSRWIRQGARKNQTKPMSGEKERGKKGKEELR